MEFTENKSYFIRMILLITIGWLVLFIPIVLFSLPLPNPRQMPLTLFAFCSPWPGFMYLISRETDGLSHLRNGSTLTKLGILMFVLVISLCSPEILGIITDN